MISGIMALPAAGEPGKPVGKLGKPVGEPSKPVGKPGKPFGEQGKSVGKLGKPIVKPGKPVGKPVVWVGGSIGASSSISDPLVVLGGWVGALARRTRPHHGRPPAEGANARNSAAGAKTGNVNTEAPRTAHSGACGHPNSVRAPPWVCSASCASPAR